MLVSAIQVLALDIDGVFTDGRAQLTPSGEQSKSIRCAPTPGRVMSSWESAPAAKSPNIVRALQDARQRGALTIAFTGAKGGPIADAADIRFRAPSESTPRIQELHILGWHAVCEIVEQALARPERDSLMPTGT